MQPFKRFGIEIEKGNFQEGAVYALAGVYALTEREISEYLKPYHLTPAKFNTLMVIKHQGKDKGLSQISIGKQLIVTASNITRLLDKLHAEGYIERLAREGDRRVHLIKITPKGSEMLDRIWPGYAKRIKEITSRISFGELKTLYKTMTQWFMNLEKKSS